MPADCIRKNADTNRLRESNRAVYWVHATRLGNFTYCHLGFYTTACYTHQTYTFHNQYRYY